ncbi:MAG: tripartite tricarboxylate transporter substrate binding protein [Burkholderiaceae bacterium]
MTRWVYRSVLFCALALLAAGAAAQPAGKPIRFVAAYTAGGVVDNTSRIVGERMARELNQPIVVENRAGANGQIGAELVAKAPPDGSTLLLTSVGIAYRQHLVKLPYDPFKDFEPVTLLVVNPLLIVVHPGLPVNSLGELVEYAKKHGLRYGSSGTGGPSHLAAELLRSMTGTSMTHVPYKGDSAAILDVVAGNLDMSVSSVSATTSFIQAGRLRAIALTSESRSPALPEVPTAAEAGMPGLIADSWVGILAPAGTPADAVQRLHDAAAVSLADPDTRARLLAGGNTIVGNTPAQFATFLRNESDKWGRVIRFANIQAD